MIKIQFHESKLVREPFNGLTTDVLTWAVSTPFGFGVCNNGFGFKCLGSLKMRLGLDFLALGLAIIDLDFWIFFGILGLQLWICNWYASLA